MKWRKCQEKEDRANNRLPSARRLFRQLTPVKRVVLPLCIEIARCGPSSSLLAAVTAIAVNVATDKVYVQAQTGPSASAIVVMDGTSHTVLTTVNAGDVLLIVE